MEDRENESKRPPRLPLHNVNRSPGQHADHDARYRNRGRSTSRKKNSLPVSKPSASVSSSVQASSTLKTLSSASSGSTTENDRKKNSTIGKSRSLSRPSDVNALADMDYDATENLGFNTITCTPQVPRYRSKSRTGESNRAGNAYVNAPKKRTKTHSKQHLIKKKENSRPRPRSRGGTSSQSRAGASIYSSGYRSDASVHTRNSEVHSHSGAIRNNISTGRKNVDPEIRLRSKSRISYSRDGTKNTANSVTSHSRNSEGAHRVRSKSRTSYSRNSDRSRANSVSSRGKSSAPRSRSNSRTSYSRDGNKSRANSVSSRGKSSAPRARSNSRTSYSRDGNKSRTYSVSSRGQRRSSVSNGVRSVCSGQLEVEPNVHHNAIMTTEIICPVIAEMKENELFAKKNGINL